MPEGAVEGAAETRVDVRECDGAGEVGLVEEGEDPVALFEAGDAGAGGDDGAGAVGGGDNGEGDGEGIFALEREVSVS